MTSKRTPAIPSMSTPLPVHQAPGFALRAAEQHRLAIWRQIVGEFPSTSLYALLLGMRADPRAHQQVLADRLSIDKATVTALVHALEQRGLVVRRPDSSDGRRRTFEVGSEVDAIVGQAAELVPQVDDELLQPLTADERHDMTRLLAKTVSTTVDTAAMDDEVDRFLASPGWLLRRTRQEHSRLWEEEAPLLTPPQYAALDVLYYKGPLEVLVTAREASLEDSSGARVLSRLSDRGLIARLRHPEDRRRVVLEITDKGMEMLSISTEGVKRVQARLTSPLNQSEAQRLHHLMARVARL